ncbi:MAG: hypothetical protein JWQ74_3539 [Marmoricola sp.]|nr:hypothetical protein [Marmoricola sp.]
MMTATMGDNLKAERERRVQFSYYHQKHRDLEAKRKAIAEEIKEVKLNAKASGFPSAKLDHYLKSFQAEDNQKPVDKHRSERENLIWLGLLHEDPQGDLLADRASGEQLIQAKGFHAGLNNLERMSHYTGGSSEDRMWLESYDAGRKEYVETWPEVEAKIRATLNKEEPPASDPFPDAPAVH